MKRSPKMEAITNRDICGLTYLDVERLIFRMCWRHVQRHGGCFDEAVSEANAAFIRAYADFRPDRTKFSTWLWWKVRGALASHRVKSFRRAARVRTIAPSLLDRITAQERFDLATFCRDLSGDATLVIGMALRQDAAASKSAIWKEIKALGWTVARAIEAFAEVREALG